jgi:hypothetical protein
MLSDTIDINIDINIVIDIFLQHRFEKFRKLLKLIFEIEVEF